MEFDLILRGGDIIDGTGAPRRRADVGVNAGRIEKIDDLSGAISANDIDVTGKAVAPGFIDIHSHSDFVVPLEDHHETLTPFLLQGITTMVTGNCGFAPAPTSPTLIPYLEIGGDLLCDRPLDYSWTSIGEFLDTLEDRKVALNVAQLVGHGVVKLAAQGVSIAPPTDDELADMRRITAESLDEGAVGLSAGLGYAPGMFATTDELSLLAEEAGRRGKPFTCHARAYTWIAPNVIEQVEGDHHLAAIAELIEVSRRSKAPLQISHLIFVGEQTWAKAEPVFELVGRSNDIDFALDMFPYTGGNTTIRVVLPPWMQANPEEQLKDDSARAQVHDVLGSLEPMIGISAADIQLLYAGDEEFDEYEGKRFNEIGEARGQDPIDAYLDAVIASRGRGRIMIHKYSGTEENQDLVHRTFELDGCAVGADTILTKKGFDNPASYGCFPRVLGPYVRDSKLFTLEEAVRKMTSLPAERMGLAGRGRVTSGFAADLVVFDPVTVGDRATFENPALPPVGIDHVYLNGTAVVTDGVARPQKVGTVIRT